MENIINTTNVNENEIAHEVQPNVLPQPAKLIYSRTLTWLAYIALVALFTSINVTRDNGSIARWLIQCLPLLIFLPGLIKQSHRAHSWVCFLTVFYFIPGVTNTMSPTGTWADIVLLASSCILFIGAAFTSRWLQYWQHENFLHRSNKSSLEKTTNS
ncbi:DUF2069 domain-containing protein [Aurantivibrio infirmus]